MHTNTSRRALLKAAPIAALATAIPTEALATSSPDRRRWDDTMRAYQQARAEDAAFDATYWRIYRAWEAGRPSMDMIEWKEFFPERCSYDGRCHVARMMDLEDRYWKFADGHEKWWWSPDPEARKREYRAALDSVKAFREAEAAHEQTSGMAAANEKWEALGARTNNAETALMEMPAPDLAALRWKLEQLREGNGEMPGWSADYIRQTYADIARLLPAGA